MTTRPPAIGLPGRRITAASLVGWPEVLQPLEIDLYLSGYAQGVLEAGGLPIHLPMDADPEQLVDRLDGLVLPGGADIDPGCYHADPHPELLPIEPERDAFELGLLAVALDRQLPILGICRGLQLINVACGGTLDQHVPDHLRLDVPVETEVHWVDTVEGSCLRRLYGPSVEVNSLHHQVVDRVGEGLTVTATAPDGIVEGLEAGDRIVAVQWHPEMMTGRPTDPSLRWLVERSTGERSS